MVRNTASIQSLRESVSDMSMSSAPATQPRQQQQQRQQSLVNLSQPTQLVGSDEYTKQLMHRIATGVATAEDRSAWEQHVTRVKAAAMQAKPQRSSTVMAGGSSRSSTVKAGGPSRQPTMHEWRLTQELREMMQRHNLEVPPGLPGTQIMDTINAAPSAVQAPAPVSNVQEQARNPVSTAQSTLQDFQMQLMLLEQQNKKRLHMARLEHEERERAEKQKQAQRANMATRQNAAKYTEPFCKYLTDNPTVFHAVDAVRQQLKDNGFTQLSERDSWDLKTGGSYFVERNGSSMVAFTVGGSYKPGNGAAILAGHVDALTAKLKPISAVPTKAGYLQLGVAPYAGAPNNTWWDRDLGIGGRVLVKEGDKIVTKLVKLDWPIARIPTLAPHFGAAANGPFNPETQMTPIIGLDDTSSTAVEGDAFANPPLVHGAHDGANAFVNTQPPKLVKAIGNALGLRTDTYANIVNWELELFDTQPAQVGGLDKEFIFAGRIDDKLCSWAAIQALVEEKSDAAESSSLLQVVGLFDDEEIGSGLRQGARSNFLPTVLERAVGALSDHKLASDVMGRTYANSFLVSSDVIHAVNPNFLNAYLENHAPHLNVGIVVSADSNGHMTTDSVSTAILKRCADTVGAKLQVFQIRNDSRSGGTVGPMLSSMTGMRAIDAGIPQLSMHSIRATTGSLDPGLGVAAFRGFLGGFEAVDKEFRD